jgi:hypothetical protein
MFHKNNLIILLIIVGITEYVIAQQVVSYGCSKGACWKDCGTGNLACYTRPPVLPDHGLNSNIAGCILDSDCNAEWNCATSCVPMIV